jgi:hypothetical protein
MNQIRRFSLPMLLSILCCLSLQAEPLLVVHIKGANKRTISITLEEKPIITFEGENLIVTTKNNRGSFPLEFVDYYEIAESTTSIEQPQSHPQKTVIANGHVVISQLADGSKVRVYTIDGKQVGNYTAGNTGQVDIDLKALPKGIFVISSPGISFKITNR